MEDNYYLFQGAKKSLIRWLADNGITDTGVLRAFDVIERHHFIEDYFLQQKAYENMPLPIACDQTISQPITVAFQSQLLQIKTGDKVLEIGTGSGFQASILAAMGAKVFTVERQIELFRKTRILLNKLKIENVKQHYGDGFLGLPQQAPFDKIIVTCGAPNVPTSLLQQLKTGGILIIPVGDSIQDMKRITKISDAEYKEETFGQFQFVPMLENLVKVNQSYF
ncbi:MAG TPA: protein-L-isoaspartate(D-aspartate) O-methyltransferase [Bacteroidales bacterium]|jgi:protein-L-isoaspartate(D-aspartate) O-methyltransferase|nr:protein-L-isoaspartate(D-aspartate) O-methyltransferase [Bacteroidales bacterium]HPT52249.1 protein-L-isoaspartate(D-aspartate) O-methyltransferase [Bacteroidales bacterium]